MIPPTMPHSTGFPSLCRLPGILVSPVVGSSDPAVVSLKQYVLLLKVVLIAVYRLTGRPYECCQYEYQQNTEESHLCHGVDGHSHDEWSVDLKTGSTVR